MSTGLENIIEAYDVTLDVGIRIGYGVADTSLSREVNYNIEVILFKKLVYESLIGYISTYEYPSVCPVLRCCLLKLSKPEFLETYVIIVVDWVVARLIAL